MGQFATVLALLRDASTQQFSHEDFSELREIHRMLANLTTEAAHAARLSDANSEVGSAKIEDYFTEAHGMSRAETRELLTRAENDFINYPQHRCAMWSLPWNKRIIIDRELQKLDDPKEAPFLLKQILDEAHDLTPEQLTTQLRQRTRRCNDTNDDPFRAEKRRKFRISKPDVDGGRYFSGYLPAYAASLLKTAVRRSFNQHAGLSHGIKVQDDRRTYDQRMADAFTHLIKRTEDTHTARTGCASIVVSMTAEDFENFRLGDRFATSTGDELSIFDIARLGPALHDYFALHTPDGNLISLTNTQRTATFLQRVALLARDLVCTHPGCDAPLDECDVHHIISFLNGGGTDIENLTLLCRHHHTSNDDTHRKPHRGHATRTPRDPRVGFSHKGNIKYNESPAARRASSQRIRTRFANSPQPPPPPG
ncbi:HNH endonuclease signature motif containing protein [Corynebacterium epidermidicanis]|uniref:HNH nuclease domain-containing protein n=1 Tax=Corynebacterium epidermidicanis TaxID=1050174 RepID=A0A0G3GV02_9CORY|nr:HNH endonuclease signature motif containing protein [Corynebacterium epidermidicanis]AKK04350.1 protein of unknown function DUF222/HNH endonuclease [Corynebacterium epidermidicanis]